MLVGVDGGECGLGRRWLLPRAPTPRPVAGWHRLLHAAHGRRVAPPPTVPRPQSAIRIRPVAGWNRRLPVPRPQSAIRNPLEGCLGLSNPGAVAILLHASGGGWGGAGKGQGRVRTDGAAQGGPGDWARGALVAVALVAIPVLLGQQAPVTVTQDLGSAADVINASGLNAGAEQSPEGPFRWGGSRVTLDLQALGAPLDATLHVSGARPGAAPAALLGAAAGGQSLGVQALPDHSTDVTYHLPLAALAAINPRLTLTATLFQPAGDRRKLGVVFFRLTTRSGPSPAWPAPWPGGLLLLSGALAYAFLRAAGRRPRWALWGVLAWGVLLGGLNAVARPWLVFYCQYWAAAPAIALLLVPWGRASAVRRRAPPLPEPLPAPSLTAQPWPLAGAVTVAALGVLAWHLIAPLIPAGRTPTDNWTYGVAFYGLLPWPLQALGVVLVIAALLIANRGLRSADDAGGDAGGRVSQVTPRAQGAASLPFAVRRPYGLIALGLALFSLLPVRFAEGDSVEFDKKILAGDVWRERELLDFYLKAKLWPLLRGIWALPSQLYAAVATLAGGVYLGGAWLLGGALGRNGRERWVIIAALCALGNILLFFGYVESYSLVAVGGLFVLWACWQYTQGRVGFGTVGALATVTPMFHGSAIWWGPMALAAWLVRTVRHPAADRRRLALAEGWEGVSVGLALLGCLAFVMLADGYDLDRLRAGLASLGGGDGLTMMHPFTANQGAEHYALFSWANLGAVVQEQLLTAPLALLTIGLMLALAGPGVRRLARAVPAYGVLAVGAAGMLFYSLTWNPDIGPRNDWDLLSQPAPALTLLAIYGLLHLPAGRARRLALTAYLSVSAVHAAAWVAWHALGIRP